jgi:IS5 family transposase
MVRSGAAMAVKATGQLGFADALVPATAGANATLERLSQLVAWERFEEVAGHLRAAHSPGRPGYPVLVLIKALILQALYGLSERELEAALSDRLSFRRFCGLSLDASVPDHSVLNRFRNQLQADGLVDRLFAELDRQLEAEGVLLKRGTMLDATLIETASRRPGPPDQARDPEARFARRAGKAGSVYGYKAHVGVDEGSGLIRTVVTTPANVNETVVADQLICGDEGVVWGDAAYHTQARVAALKARGVKARLAIRPHKTHPVLPPRLKRYNRLIARRRAGVETTFATLKQRMGLTVIRSVGLAKAAAQVLWAALAFNLRRWTKLSPA